MTVSVTGDHERKAEAEAEFTVKPKAEPAPQPKTKRDSDRGFTVKWPVYTYLNGEVPASAGSGSWEKQPGGVWKFHKDGSADAPGSGAAGPAAAVTDGARYAANEWLYIDGFWYLFDADGRMVVDWACVNGAWYYLSTAEYAAADAGLKEGAMVTGWLFDPFTRQWYWLDESGVMAVGWVEIDGRRYYFNPESDGKRGALKEEP
ncbi:hypothetical protein V3C10_12085 [[Clostridium] symbiosum]|uniref:hypothetical protein n=1 Tax=Clostridium symbiosum TaxID=1512 RepID=UPI001D07A471|nr:hypothetical protein [[Clostridium] symbiosum]MCB6608879.1 hypothetical protein [[Clostridium] symbiosum]MCB6930194.1 hypothetical protein [[Clostridium] symbiosum]